MSVSHPNFFDCIHNPAFHSFVDHQDGLPAKRNETQALKEPQNLCAVVCSALRCQYLLLHSARVRCQVRSSSATLISQIYCAFFSPFSCCDNMTNELTLFFFLVALRLRHHQTWQRCAVAEQNSLQSWLKIQEVRGSLTIYNKIMRLVYMHLPSKIRLA